MLLWGILFQGITIHSASGAPSLSAANLATIYPFHRVLKTDPKPLSSTGIWFQCTSGAAHEEHHFSTAMKVQNINCSLLFHVEKWLYFPTGILTVLLFPKRNLLFPCALEKANTFSPAQLKKLFPFLMMLDQKEKALSCLAEGQWKRRLSLSLCLIHSWPFPLC